MSTSQLTLRSKVIGLYKTLLYIGRDYPKGYGWFRDRAHNAFYKNKELRDEEQIGKLIKHGEFVVEEIKALYALRKYRTMKQRYYNEEDEIEKQKLEIIEQSHNKV